MLLRPSSLRAGIVAVCLCACVPQRGALSSHSARGAPKPKPWNALDLRGCSERLLDDLEDGDTRSSALYGVAGAWRSYHDLDGTRLSPEGAFVPSSGGARGSKHAAHIQGRTARASFAWAGVALDLAQPLAARDLSEWSGFCFMAKGRGTVRVGVPDVNTDPAGGVCKACNNIFGTELSLSPEWQERCVTFADLKQIPGWGEQRRAVAQDRALMLTWAAMTPDADYDVWIDDVRLVCD